VICTVDKKQKFEAEFVVRIGRGFSTGDENKRADMPLGVIPIDSIFSPVIRVKYSVENTRVGQRTDCDKLILEIWTDGRITPDDALLQASAILRHPLDVFVNYGEGQTAMRGVRGYLCPEFCVNRAVIGFWRLSLAESPWT